MAGDEGGDYLEKRVAVFKNVREIRLYDFAVTEWEPEMQGAFRADFDGRACPDEFVFLFDAEGRLCAAPEMGRETDFVPQG
jgi:hypothetical protein